LNCTIIQPPHKKKVFPPVANPIEQGCKENKRRMKTVKIHIYITA
jgi:hypothetical protein